MNVREWLLDQQDNVVKLLATWRGYSVNDEEPVITPCKKEQPHISSVYYFPVSDLAQDSEGTATPSSMPLVVLCQSRHTEDRTYVTCAEIEAWYNEVTQWTSELDPSQIRVIYLFASDRAISAVESDNIDALHKPDLLIMTKSEFKAYLPQPLRCTYVPEVFFFNLNTSALSHACMARCCCVLKCTRTFLWIIGA